MKNLNKCATYKEQYDASYLDYTWTAGINYINKVGADIKTSLFVIINGFIGLFWILLHLFILLTFPISVFVIGAIHKYVIKKRLIKQYPEFIKE